VLDLCAFKSDGPLRYVYLQQLTSDQCEENWRKFEEPEVRRYALPLNINSEVSNTYIE